MTGRWSAPTLVLHWLGAGLVLFLLAQGWLMVHGGFDAAPRFDAYQTHKSWGFVALALTLLRLAARATAAAPPAPPEMARWERMAASATHRVMYALMLLAALSGWVLVGAAVIAIPTRFFGAFIIPNLGPPDAMVFASAAQLHVIVSRLIMALLALHVAAALKHHFVDRDDVLTRMLRLGAR